MKLSHICEEETAADPKEVRRQIQEYLDRAEQNFKASIVGSLLESTTFANIIKACDKDTEEFINDLQANLRSLKSSLHVDVMHPSTVTYKIQDLWAGSVDKIFEDVKKEVMSEGLLQGLGSFFRNIMTFLIKSVTAGITTGAMIGGAILRQSAGGNYSDYGRYGRGKGRKAKLSDIDARKLRNATFADRIITPVSQLATSYKPVLDNIANYYASAPGGRPATIYSLTNSDLTALGL